MNNEQLKVGVAAHVGWTIVPSRWCAKMLGWHPKLRQMGKTQYPGYVPEYPSDLNAMAMAEETLSDSQMEVMQGHLEECGCWPLWRADARQRAVAFLKTVGKWENENVEESQ